MALDLQYAPKFDVYFIVTVLISNKFQVCCFFPNLKSKGNFLINHGGTKRLCWIFYYAIS